MEISSGEYRVSRTESAHSGKAALILAGTKGAASVETNSFAVPGGSLLVYDAWLRPELVEGGQSSVCVRFTDVEGKETVEAASVTLNAKSKDWQQVRSYCRANEQSAPLSATLAFHLNGPGLVRIDDVRARVFPISAASIVDLDGDFESSGPKGGFPDWEAMSASTKFSIEQYKESPIRGESCVRVQGEAGWTVLTTRKATLPKTGRIFAQGFIRSPKGTGILKLDYIKDGKCFENSHSAEIHSNQWQLVTVESNSQLAAECDEIHLTLGASNPDGTYIVDFDKIEVISLN